MKLYIKTTTNGISYNQGNERVMSEAFNEELRQLSIQMWESAVSLCREHWSSISTVAEELIQKKWLTKNQIMNLIDQTEDSLKEA